MPYKDVLYVRTIIKCIVKGKENASGIPEDVLDAFLTQAFQYNLSA
jgi:hypothetical protein